MGRHKREPTGTYSLRLPLRVLQMLAEEQIPHRVLAHRFGLIVAEEARNRERLRQEIAEAREYLSVLESREHELAEVEERERLLRAASPVVELLVDEVGVRDLRRAGATSLDRWLSDPKIEALLHGTELASLPRSRLLELLVQGANRHEVENRRLVASPAGR